MFTDVRYGHRAHGRDDGGTRMIEMIIVGTIGVGYAVVGTLQWLKGDMGAGIMWIGYAFAQIGLFLNLK
jgi:hypothetical protein